MDIFRRPLALFCRIFVKSLHKTNFRRLAYHDDGTSTSDSFFCRSVLSKYILHKVEKNQFSPTCLSRRQPGLGLFLAMFCPQLVTSNHLEFDLARHDSNLAMKSGKTSCKIISFSLLRTVLPTASDQKSAKWGSKNRLKIGPTFSQIYPHFLTPSTLFIAFLCDNFFEKSEIMKFF